MRIAVVVSEFNIRGGTTKQVHRLVEYLLSKKHHVEIVTTLYKIDNCYPGTEVFSVKSFEKHFHKKNTNAFSRFIGTHNMANYIINNFDCVNIHDNGNTLLNFFIKLRKPKMPVIWQINDIPVEFGQANLANVKKKWYFNLKQRFIKYVANKNDIITVNVSKNSELVQKFFKMPATVLHCGVDLRSNNYREKQPIKSVIRLVSTGIFFPFRNYETLLKVQEYLGSKGFVIEVHIIGTMSDKKYSNRISRLVEERNLNCKLHGDVSEEKLLKLYEESDIFLFLNIDQSWGLAIFEAMNLSIPTIVSNSVGAIELLESNKNAVIVNPLNVEEISNVVIRLSNDNSFRNFISRNAYQLTSKMTWDNMYSSKVESMLISLTNYTTNA